jgi:hypothetical protein
MILIDISIEGLPLKIATTGPEARCDWITSVMETNLDPTTSIAVMRFVLKASGSYVVLTCDDMGVVRAGRTTTNRQPGSPTRNASRSFAFIPAGRYHSAGHLGRYHEPRPTSSCIRRAPGPLQRIFHIGPRGTSGCTSNRFLSPHIHWNMSWCGWTYMPSGFWPRVRCRRFWKHSRRILMPLRADHGVSTSGCAVRWEKGRRAHDIRATHAFSAFFGPAGFSFCAGLFDILTAPSAPSLQWLESSDTCVPVYA